ncbi:MULTISPECIES: hypothetical protein [Sporosarcina]|uniref:Uncharacterized protein n=1 Tax=Sporosarcina newyorkensis TaxID=759851 RepID=A0A1T4Y1R6_9BACL|nr:MULTISPECIES: hypothetical protein [Sporosarcina]MBY0223484.1 hypothetical protein [Sporosarcina aquimarina]SKA95710.1 hypothetical protein SAMN04244570_1695 [Sporosarcina newyorkensis]
MDKVKSNSDLLFSTVGLVVILFLLIAADKLLGPIKDRLDHEIAGEKFNNFFQALGNIIKAAFVKPVIAVDHTYNQFTNLFAPMLLVILAFIIAVTVCIVLCKSLLQKEDAFLNKIIVGIWIVIFLGLIYFIARVGWYLIALNFKVMLVSALAILIVGSIFTVGVKGRKTNALS